MSFTAAILVILIVAAVVMVVATRKMQQHHEHREQEPGDASQKIDAVRDEQRFREVMDSSDPNIKARPIDPATRRPKQ